MKTAIVYYSAHHGNTKKVLDALAKEHEITLIDVSENHTENLSDFDLIGFASGIYYQTFHKNVLRFAEDHLPDGKKVFFIATYGFKRKSYTEAIRSIAESKNAIVLGEYGCPGFDTFGPLRFIGGIAKGRPNQKDIAGALRFMKEIEAKI